MDRNQIQRQPEPILTRFVARNSVAKKYGRLNTHSHAGTWVDSNHGCVVQSIYDFMHCRLRCHCIFVTLYSFCYVHPKNVTPHPSSVRSISVTALHHNKQYMQQIEYKCKQHYRCNELLLLLEETETWGKGCNLTTIMTFYACWQQQIPMKEIPRQCPLSLRKG